MSKFDPDFAIFGIFSGEIKTGVRFEDTVIDYANKACLKLFGDLRGKTISEIIHQASFTDEEAKGFLDSLLESGVLAFEGKLKKRVIKLHSRIIDCRDDDACAIIRFIQGGIMDITESTILKKLLYGTSEALKRAAEAADEDTGHHVERINHYARQLAILANAGEKFSKDIGQFAQLHDIGKIKVAEIIRLPRKLTAEEFELVKKHSEYGAEMVAGLEGLEMATDITLDHHEKWDGSGYPNGKKGKEISLAGRIVKLADVFDALVSERPYKKPFSYARTREILEKGDGRVMPSHFDPELLDLFLAKYDDFIAKHKKIKD